MSISKLGPVVQLAYVPSNFEAAIDFWTRTMGVGPFFHLPHVKPLGTWYRGKRTEIDFSVALTYWNEMQIELIEVHDDVPSVYSDWLKNGHEGLHHVCILTADLDNAKRVCQDANAEVLQELLLDGGGAVYVDVGGGPGTMVEILQPSDAINDLFVKLREAARDWDGSDPLRTYGLT